MKRIITALCAFGIFSAPAALMAQDDDDGDVGRVYIVSVKDGQGDAFEEGVKAWMKCYGENDGQKSWNVWQSETGKLGRYAFTTGGHKWAVWDEYEEASQACEEIFQNQFLPHVDKAVSEFTSYMDEQSNIGDDEYNVVWVIDFKVTDSRKFVGAISKITEAAKESDWGNYAWYNIVAGGRHAGDFFIVVAEKNFAGFDVDDQPLWEMVAEVHGEEAAEQIRGDIMAAVEYDWSNIWRRRPDLGYSPEE